MPMSCAFSLSHHIITKSNLHIIYCPNSLDMGTRHMGSARLGLHVPLLRGEWGRMRELASPEEILHRRPPQANAAGLL